MITRENRIKKCADIQGTRTSLPRGLIKECLPWDEEIKPKGGRYKIGKSENPQGRKAKGVRQRLVKRGPSVSTRRGRRTTGLGGRSEGTGTPPRQKKLQDVSDRVEGVLEFVSKFKVEFKIGA